MTDPTPPAPKKNHVWHAEGSLPPEEYRNWRKNIQVTVIASTLSIAVAAVENRHQGIELHKVMRDRDAHDLIEAREATHD